MIRPVAQFYKSALPPQVRAGVRNFFNNVQMIPTVANDLLQGQPLQAYKDTWRFFLNSTMGIAGILDVAESCHLPYKPNDFGITLAKWGDTESPYFVMPIFGPSTLRDAVGLSMDYSVFSIYPYLKSDKVVYGMFGLNMIEVRADLLDTEPLVDEALDEYTLVRDAYLQNRNYKITGQAEMEEADESLYIAGEGEVLGDPKTEETQAKDKNNEEDGALYIEEDETAHNQHIPFFHNQISKIS